MPAPIPVRPGQIWADADRRKQGRQVRIVDLDPRWAYYVVVAEANTPRTSRSTIGRRSYVEYTDRGLRGYRLVSEPDDTAGSAT